MNTSLTRLSGLRPSAAGMRYATFLVNAALVAVLAWTSAQLAWHVIPAGTPEAAPAPAAVGDTERRADRPGSERGERIAQLHLFGRAGPLDRVDDTPIDAPETRLNLTLRGVFHSPSQERALVIISRGNQGEDFYRVGDQLPGGATLAAIHPDRVILRREGRHETLSLPQERLDTGSAETDSAAARPASAEPAAGRGDDVRELRQRLLQNPADFNRMVRVEPYMQDGEFRGVVLNPGPEPGALEAMGLQPGDVVTSINGQALNSPEAAMGVMQQIGDASALELTIVRDNLSQTVRVDFD
ncbi:MAG: type II secretion system protein GspC [Ectothiorhodospiraceae bacterium]|nr:type II secretion system protein GspC [Ectothiorhodospiraceae bacterium]